MNSTRDKILYTAFTMFINDGYKAVSISELVKRCGVTKGGIYHHFEGKEQIFSEILRCYFMPVLQKLLSDIRALEGDAQQRIDGIFELYEASCSAVSTYPGFPELEYGIYYLMIEGSKYDARFKEAVSSLYGGLFEATEQVLRGGITEGIFRELKDPAATARAIISLIEGSYFLWIVNKSQPLQQVFAAARELAVTPLLKL